MFKTTTPLLLGLWCALLALLALAPTATYAKRIYEPKDIQQQFQQDVEGRELSGYLGTCEGDCDYDSDCAGHLVCCQRDAGDPIPCCTGFNIHRSTDRCAPQSCCPPPTPHPTPHPTLHPTPSPTPAPVADPTEAPGDEVDIDVTLCFSEHVTVSVLGKGETRMKDLNVGDKILTSDNHYETVYAFGHYDPDRKAHFLQLETTTATSATPPQQKTSSTLEMTGDHLLYRHGNTYPVRASAIQVGDRLVSSLGYPTETVTKITTVTRSGIYTPLTTSGTFLVNHGRIKVSSYAALQQSTNTGEYGTLQNGFSIIPQHLGIHMVLTPYRWYCRVMTDASGYCTNVNDQGMPEYVDKGIQILQWAAELPSSWMQMALFVPALMIFGVMFAVEQLLFFNDAGSSSGMMLTTLLGLATILYVGSFSYHPQRTTTNKAKLS